MPEACFIGKSVTADAVTWNAVIYRLTGRGFRKRSATCRETKSISDRMWEFGAVVRAEGCVTAYSSRATLIENAIRKN